MSNLNNFFDSLYTHFLLRDILAKVIPGLVTLIALINIFTYDIVENIIDFLEIANLPIYLVLYGLSFITGLLVQHIGMKAGFTKKFTQEDVSDYLTILYDFYENSKDRYYLLRQRERLVVLKEMSGNFGMALIVVFMVWLFKFVNHQFSANSIPIVLGLILVISIIGLWSLHRFLANELFKWEEIITNPKKKDKN